jgi:hypothetical protein
LVALNATAGGPSVHVATAVAPDASVTPLRKNAVRLLTPVVKQLEVRVAVLVEKLVLALAFNGVYPPVTHLPASSHGPRLS